MKLIVSKQMKSRIGYIDIAKGIGMVMIFIFHSGIGWSANDGISQWINNFISIGYIPIFFFISGFLYHDYSLKRRFFNVFNNLFLPYCFGSFFIIALLLILGNEYKSVFKGFLYGNGGQDQTILKGASPIGAIWFFLAMAVATLAFSIIYKLLLLILKKQSLIAGTLLFISLVLSLLAIRKSFYPYLLPLDIQSGTLGFFYMAVGFLAKLLFQKNPHVYHKLINNIFLFIIALLAWVVFSHNNILYFVSAVFSGSIWQIFIATICSIFVILYISSKLERFSTKALKWIGMNSNLLMVTHDWVLIFLQANYINKGLYYLHLPSYWGWTLSFAIISALTIINCQIIYRLRVFNPIFYNRKWPIKYN